MKTKKVATAPKKLKAKKAATAPKKAATAPKKDLSEADVLNRANIFELEASKNIYCSVECTSALQILLNDVYVGLRPKPSDYERRGDLVQNFNILVKKVIGNDYGFPVVEAFGSFIMDIFTSESDLDLSINFGKKGVFPRERKISVLKKFLRMLYALQGRGHVFNVQSITQARVPILKVTDAGTGIECDLSVENKDGMLKSKILAIISTIDERFQKLCFMMKAWAKIHGINSSKDGTLNSLSIVSLVAFHFQTRVPPIFPSFSALLRDGCDLASVENVVRGFRHFGRKNSESLSELFVTLLIKLSAVETLWPLGLCASTYQGSWILKTWNSKVGNFSVEDFTDRTQNVARAVGEAEVEQIYQCIHLSLQHISSFFKGQIVLPRLRELLFGPDAFDPRTKPTDQVTLKRRFTSQQSVPPGNSFPNKRMHPAGANDPWNRTLLPANAQPPANLSQWGNPHHHHPQIGFQAVHEAPPPPPPPRRPHGLIPAVPELSGNRIEHTPNRGSNIPSWPVWPPRLQQPPMVPQGPLSWNQMASAQQAPTQYTNSVGHLQRKSLPNYL